MKLPTKWKEFIIAMMVIPLFAAIVGYGLFSKGPVVSTPSRTVTMSSPRGAAPAAPKGAPTISQSTDNGSQPVAKAPTTNPRGGMRTESMQAHELFEMLDKNPSAISYITFMNGSDSVTVVKAGEAVQYVVTLPAKGGVEEVLKAARDKNVFFKAETDSSSGFRNFLWNFGPFILIGLIWLFFLGRNGAFKGMGNPAAKAQMNIGKAKTTDKDKEGALRKVTFNDVAGADEAIKELRRISKGLKRRRLYSWFGVKLPKGILLVGPPGTGKTLLARAVAGETEGSFASTSGSDFVEMFVGVGASRVRDMFEEGRKKVKETGKPHIIFIDEIDAVGGARGGGGTSQSRNDEREQTLNALLVEMDGMKNNEGLIIIAATNRADMLDEALMRPGRFDVQVDVPLPSKDGREAIFKIHTRNKPLAEGVSCAILAARTYGYSGAEIESACNRAGILAAERYGLTIPEDADDAAIEAALKELNAAIEMKDFDEGVDFVRYGATDPARQKGMSENERENTTVHEGGHAIVSDVMPGSDPIVKITNVNRSKALGYVQNMPGEDRYSLDVTQIIARIVTAMAGRAAQELILDKCDTGAANDYEQACGLAYNMVTKWGMSKLGHISVGGRGTSMRGMGGSGPISNYGPKLADQIDDEWRRIVEACHDLAVRIVTEDRERLEALIVQLKADETILADGWKEFAKKHPSKIDPKTLVIDLKPERKGA